MAIQMVIHLGYGNITTGLWCPHCLKPSGFELPTYWLRTSGVSPLGVLRKCDDCGAPLKDDQ